MIDLIELDKNYGLACNYNFVCFIVTARHLQYML